MKKVNVFGVDYTITDYQGASELIIDKAKKYLPFAVFALPVHGVIASRSDEELKLAVQSADLIVADGQPIRWVMNYFGNANMKDRVYGPKLMNNVLIKANRENLTLFLYGGSTDKVLTDFQLFISNTYPGIRILGAYREEEFGLDTISIETLNKARPHIVLVGLGCPTQEKWIARHKNDIDAVLIGVGAAFSFFAGATKMAPNWMQDRGLEWLYRLFKEPRRLWHRYLYNNSYFILLIVKKYFSIRNSIK